MSYPSGNQGVEMGIPVNYAEKVQMGMPYQSPPPMQLVGGPGGAVIVNITTKDDNLVPAGLVGFLFGEIGLAGVFCACNTPKGRLGGCAGFTGNKFCNFLIMLVLLIVALSTWHEFPADNREHCTANGGTWFEYYHLPDECLCPPFYLYKDNMCVPYMKTWLIAITVALGATFLISFCFTAYFYSRRNDSATNVSMQQCQVAQPTTESLLQNAVQ